MAILNEELMHECSPKHSRMGIAKMKYDKETDEKDKKRHVSIDKSKQGKKGKRSPDGLNYPNQNSIIINIICQYFIRDGKNTMKLNKKQNGLYEKNQNRPSIKNIVLGFDAFVMWQ